METSHAVTIILYIYTAIMGLCIGSFLNVVVLRAFSGESIVLPPSKCPKCKTKLKWYDNIPVFSYLFLRGKCRYCKEKISIQYPLVEAFTCIMFLLTAWHFGFSWSLLFPLTAVSICIVMMVTDFKEHYIFDTHAYILGALGLIYNFFNIAGVNTTKIHFFLFEHMLTVNQTFIYSVLGLIAGAGVMAAIIKITKLITGKDCFGEGDAYILGALGAFFGISNVIVIFILGFIFQALWAIPLLFVKLFKNKQFKLLTTLILLFITCGLYYTAAQLDLFDSNIFYIFCFALITAMGIYCCKNLLGSIKTDDNLIAIPFGPALIIAAFVVMFV